MNKRKALSILLTVALIIGLMPGMALNAKAETIISGLWVGDSAEVTKQGLISDIGGTGTASVSIENNSVVLTLDGFNYEGKGCVTEPINTTGSSGSEIASAVFYKGEAPLIIEMKNDSSITQTGNDKGDSYGIYSCADLIIKGEGSLTVTTGKTSVDSVAVCGGADIEIMGGKITVTGGEAIEEEGDSYGVYAEGRVGITRSNVTASGGTAGYNSQGIYGNSGVTITNSNINAWGGSAEYVDSTGISGHNDSLTISGGNVTAAGGTAYAHSYGIYGSDGITITDGAEVIAVGGDLTNENAFSSGICGYKNGITITDGARVTATGGETDGYNLGIFEYSVDGDELIIGDDIEYIVASGRTTAIAGFLSNEIKGKGWVDIEGTEGETPISVESAQILNENIKYAVFPENFKPVKNVKLDKDTLNLTTGSSAKLSATIEPDGATDSTLTWKSSDADIATVDENGNVKAVAEGSAVITVAAGNGKTAECSVTVTKKSSGGHGGGGGSSSSPIVTPGNNREKTTTDSNGNTITASKGTDGTETIIIQAPDNGQRSVTTKTADGMVASEVTIPASVADAANKNSSHVILNVPGDIAVTEILHEAPQFKIDVPDGTKDLQVAIPVTGATAGTVAVLAGEDGSEVVIPECIVDSNGMINIVLNGDTTVKIVINDRDFEDVPSSHWAHSYIDFVSSRLIFEGMGDFTFAPDEEMIRYMFPQVMYNMELDPTGGSSAVFEDIESGHWAEKAVGWAVANKIINGYSSTEFGGDDNVTREQIATMLYRYSGSPVVGPTGEEALKSFSDADNISEYAQAAMGWAIMNGIMNGMDSTTLAPQDNAARAQVAAMIERYIEKVVFTVG